MVHRLLWPHSFRVKSVEMKFKWRGSKKRDVSFSGIEHNKFTLQRIVEVNARPLHTENWNWMTGFSWQSFFPFLFWIASDGSQTEHADTPEMEDGSLCLMFQFYYCWMARCLHSMLIYVFATAVLLHVQCTKCTKTHFFPIVMSINSVFYVRRNDRNMQNEAFSFPFTVWESRTGDHHWY